MKKLIVDYINKLRKNEYFIKYINQLRESKFLIKYINKLKENEYLKKVIYKLINSKYITEYYPKFRKNKYFVPAAVALCLIMLCGITVTVKSIIATQTVKKASIAASVAQTDFFDGKYDAAIEEYTKLQEKDEWPFWNVKIAEIYSIKGELVKSNEILRKAYESRNKIIDTKKANIDNLEEKDKELANYITFTSLMNGEYKKALEYGEVFMQEYPNDRQLLKTMFSIYMANGNKDKAKEIIDKYGKEKLEASDLTVLAKMNMLIDNMDEGLSLLKDAWIKDKNEIRVFDVIAQVADYNKADILDKISKLQKNDPNELAYKMWTAKIYSMSKDSAEKAEKLIDELENKDVGSINLKLIKANMYDSLEKTEKLNDILSEIVKSDEKSLVGYHAAAWLAYNNGNYDDAFKNCEKSIEMDKDYSDNYVFLMPEIMEKQDKSEDVDAYFRTALYKDPFNYEIILKTAEYYGNTLKSSSKALYYYDFASKMNPKDAEIYYNMALIKINNQREDEAVELLKKSISISDKNPKYHRTLGTIYINKEKNEDAIKEIRTAYNLDKNDIKTLNNAGCYYISVEGDVARGMTNLKAAYDGINDKTSADEKDTITDNYTRVKDLSDAYNKRNGATLKIPDLKLFY